MMSLQCAFGGGVPAAGMWLQGSGFVSCPVWCVLALSVTPRLLFFV